MFKLSLTAFLWLNSQAKTVALLDKYGVVSHLNSDRCLQLERAQSLAVQFWETYEEVWPWLQETLATFGQLPPPAIEYEALRQQQEELRVRIGPAGTGVTPAAAAELNRTCRLLCSKCGS